MRRMPRRMALVEWPVGMGLVFGGIPLLVSELGSRHGWSHGTPRGWNLWGLVPLGAGAALIAWALAVHYLAAPQGWALRRGIGPAYRPEYLLRRGPYARTRNPIYVGEAAILLGWAVFLGSLATAVGLVAFVVGIRMVVTMEERKLLNSFGDAYRQYTSEVARFVPVRRRGRREDARS